MLRLSYVAGAAVSYVMSCYYLKQVAFASAVETTGACYSLSSGFKWMFVCYGIIGRVYWAGMEILPSGSVSECVCLCSVVILGIRGYKRFDKDNYAPLGVPYQCSRCDHIYDPEKDGEGKNFEDLSGPCDIHIAFGKPWKCPQCGAQLSAYKAMMTESDSEEAVSEDKDSAKVVMDDDRFLDKPTFFDKSACIEVRVPEEAWSYCLDDDDLYDIARAPSSVVQHENPVVEAKPPKAASNRRRSISRETRERWAPVRERSRKAQRMSSKIVEMSSSMSRKKKGPNSGSDEWIEKNSVQVLPPELPGSVSLDSTTTNRSSRISRSSQNFHSLRQLTFAPGQ